MKKYHMGKSGRPTLCRAEEGNCPLGGPHGTLAELESALAENLETLSSMDSFDRLPESEPWPKSLGSDEADFWRGPRRHFGVFVHRGRPYALGSPGEGTQYCFDCYTRIPETEELRKPSWTVACPGCGKKCQDGLVGVTLNTGSYRFFHKQAVLESEWYHYSSREDWDKLMSGSSEPLPMVHVGTKESALDRMAHTLKEGKKGVLFKVTLKSDSFISDEILEDDPHNGDEAPLAADSGEADGVSLGGVTRYMNYYESPGSISLVLNPKCLESIEKVELT